MGKIQKIETVVCTFLEETTGRKAEFRVDLFPDGTAEVKYVVEPPLPEGTTEDDDNLPAYIQLAGLLGKSMINCSLSYSVHPDEASLEALRKEEEGGN